MEKPRYRFSHKTGKWEQVYRFTANVAHVTGLIDPRTGIPKTINLPYINKGLLGA